MPKKNKSLKKKVKTIQGPKPTITEIIAQPRPKKNALAVVEEFMTKVDSSKPAQSAGELLGAKLGKFAGALLGRITGTGDYQADLPAGGLPIEESMVPQFIKSDNSRETRIRHREFVGNVYAAADAGAFKNTSYALNPGNTDAFPWLAGIAQHYDSWEPHGAVVIFKSLTSTYAASQSLGTVIIASDYDVYDSPYISKVEMANSQFAVSGNAAQSLMHPIECNSNERMTKLFTVSNGPLQSSDNKRFFDLCNVQVASEGCLANQLLGELWITYDFSFYKPQVPLNPTGLGSIRKMFYCSGTAGVAPANSPFTGVKVFSPYGTDDLITNITPNAIYFADKYVGFHFLVQIRYVELSSVTTTQFSYFGCQQEPNMWTLASNITPSTGVVGGTQIWQAHISILPATNGVHYMQCSTSPALADGINNLFVSWVSIDQIAPDAFNYGAWAPIP